MSESATLRPEFRMEEAYICMCIYMSVCAFNQG